MNWLTRAQELENDDSSIGTLLFWDAMKMAIREELDAWRHLQKEYSEWYRRNK